MKTLRARITILSALILTIVLGVAAVVIVTQVDRQLRNQLADQRDETMDGIADQIREGEDPERIRLPLGTDGVEYTIYDPNAEEFVNSSILFYDPEIESDDLIPDLVGEVIDGELEYEFTDDFTDEFGEEFGEELGEVLIEEVLTDPATIGLDQTNLETAFLQEIFFDADIWESTSQSVAAPDGREYEVLAFSSIDVVERSVSQVQSVLLIAIPALALIFGGLVWLMAGRTLRPVDQITMRAAEISTDTLHQRLEQPTADDEIGRLTKTLNTMLDRLDRGATQQRQFVSDASHELRSPLTVLIGEAELAAQSNDPERLASANALVIEHGNRMNVLIQDLLDLAKASETQLAKSDVDLDDVLNEQAAIQSRVVGTSKVSTVRIQGNARSLGRLFRNLIDNASRYAHSTVELSCHVDGDVAVVNVDDDGPGIPRPDRDKIFERFARVDDSRTRATGGTGLGLAIAKAIVDNHGGTISVLDSPQGGTRMQVRLPVELG